MDDIFKVPKYRSAPRWLKRAPIAHRGIFDNGNGLPENSLKAFESAIRLGYPFEFDVRVTADNVPVVFHDESLERMTGYPDRIISLPYKDIKDLSLLDTGQRIPTLEETLRLVNGRVPVMVEVKNRRKAGEGDAAVHAVLKKYKGDFTVHSFNPETVAWFADNAADINRGLVFNKYTQSNLLAAVKQARPSFMAFKFRLIDPLVVVPFRRAGWPVVAYTVRSAHQRFEALEECDNVIFEGFLPDLRVETLIKEGFFKGPPKAF